MPKIFTVKKNVVDLNNSIAQKAFIKIIGVLSKAIITKKNSYLGKELFFFFFFFLRMGMKLNEGNGVKLHGFPYLTCLRKETSLPFWIYFLNLLKKGNLLDLDLPSLPFFFFRISFLNLFKEGNLFALWISLLNLFK